MIKSKQDLLIQLLDSEELTSNTIAWVFAKNPSIDISSREKFFDTVIQYYLQYSKERPKIEREQDTKTSSFAEWLGRDLRIKNVRLKSLRGYPESEIPFGIDFTNENGEPQSMIILGGNASGKSSIYDAIEYSYCNTIGEALLRGYKQGASENFRFQEFLRHLDNPVNSIMCKIETVSTLFDIQKENIPSWIRSKINPDTHFISDYDIYQKGQLDYEGRSEKSFHNTIAESLGLRELLQFERNLKSFTVYRRQTESRNAASLKRSNELLLSLIENNQKAIEKKKAEIEKLKQTETPNPEEKENQALLNILNQVKSPSISFSFDFKKLALARDQFLEVYERLNKRQRNFSNVKEINFLNLGLELLKEHTNCPLCLNSKNSKEEIETNVSKRIIAIHELNELTQEVNKQFNQVMDLLTNYKNQTDLVRTRLSAEIQTIKEKVELNQLLQHNNEFLTFISGVSATDFYSEISSFEQNPSFLKDRNLFMSKFLTQHDIEINDSPQSINNTLKFIQSRSEIIESLTKQIQSNQRITTGREQIVVLEKEVRELENQISSAKFEHERDEKRLNDLIEKQVLFDKVKGEVSQYAKELHNTLNKEVEEAFGQIKLVVEEILESYFRSDNRNVDLVISKKPDEIDEETGEALSQIITAQIIPKGASNAPQSVTRYLNTFHYRLFSSLVAISVAIASRIRTKINVPVVLDDIFYSSDFENKTTVEDFLTELFSLFHRFTPDMPLQLILFTHDQQIFESAVKVTRENGYNLSYAKLFPPIDAKREENYLNLIYKFSEFSFKKLTESLVAKYDFEL